jgi:hypothetical protein
MASLTLATPDIRTRFGVSSLLSSLLRKRLYAPDTSPAAERAAQGFAHEVLMRHPDAFASELDVECMMHRCRGQF